MTMERLTIKYEGLFVPKKTCTIDRFGEADDCDSCDSVCESDCENCAVQECFTRLGEYEETGLMPEQIREIDHLYTEKCREVEEMQELKKVLDNIYSLHRRILRNKFAEEVTDKEITALVAAEDIIQNCIYNENGGWIPVGERLPTMEEYQKTICDDRVSGAFARLFCDYMTRSLGLYPVFVTAAFWLRDRRSRMEELIGSRQIGTAKFIVIRCCALLTAVMVPVILLSFESLIPLLKYSADTGIFVDPFAFIKYILWWLLPTAMIVISLGTLLTVLTSSPAAIAVQFLWWFADSSITSLSGDVRLYTLMIRHNMLRGSELIQENFAVICLNRGLLVLASALFLWLSIVIYKRT